VRTVRSDDSDVHHPGVPDPDVPVRDVPVRDVPVRDVPVRDVPVRDVPVRTTTVVVWPVFSLPDANWEAPYSARFQVGASAPGG
jgi:hypothetical protein